MATDAKFTTKPQRETPKTYMKIFSSRATVTLCSATTFHAKQGEYNRKVTRRQESDTKNNSKNNKNIRSERERLADDVLRHDLRRTGYASPCENGKCEIANFLPCLGRIDFKARKQPLRPPLRIHEARRRPEAVPPRHRAEGEAGLGHRRAGARSFVKRLARRDWNLIE